MHQTNETTPDGEAIPGSWVHPSTRRRHWAQNSTPQDNHRIPPVSALPSIPPPNETSPASEPDSEPAETLSEAESIRHIYYFIAWLSLVCGVSQANCRIARDWIIFIIKIFQKLPRDRTEYLESYKDSRTITKHLGLDPEIESSICCQSASAFTNMKTRQPSATLSTSFQAIHSSLGVSHSALQFLAEMPHQLLCHNPAKCATDNNQNLLLNFSSLVICTNIVSLKSINDSDSNKLAEAYSLYTETSKLVFDSPKILPNHHYALHLPEQMKWWGPLSNVSEFSGERVNGILQKMKTNGIIGQIEGTVLREFCQIQRLNSQAPRWSLKIDNNECDNESQAKPSRLVQVHPDIYMAILQKLQSEDPTLRHYQDLPHPDGSRVVTPYANEEDTFESTSGLYISKTKQNRLVAYQKDGHTRYAWVTHVYSLPDFNNRILVAVKALADACTGDAINIGQSFLQTLNDLELKVVQENPNRELLDPGQVIAVCAYRHLPAWTFRFDWNLPQSSDFLPNHSLHELSCRTCLSDKTSDKHVRRVIEKVCPLVSGPTCQALLFKEMSDMFARRVLEQAAQQPMVNDGSDQPRTLADARTNAVAVDVPNYDFGYDHHEVMALEVHLDERRTSFDLWIDY
ncbi:hypothetical protein PSHT_03580 [Puccinia striiformis]|uniref:Uncharacterized protein n=1 Tax=Puccinia striiformis TaxID=27350 RepID=A0A2S4WF23_9BASI|nr:hypothetical protein PSHT_03580 [Puccinia striiformis]